jgi:hypothetical protein
VFTGEQLEETMYRLVALGALCLLLGGCYYPYGYGYGYGYGYPPPRYSYAPPPGYAYPAPGPYPYAAPGQPYAAPPAAGMPQTLGPNGDTSATGGN